MRRHGGRRSRWGVFFFAFQRKLVLFFWGGRQDDNDGTHENRENGKGRGRERERERTYFVRKYTRRERLLDYRDGQ